MKENEGPGRAQGGANIESHFSPGPTSRAIFQRVMHGVLNIHLKLIVSGFRVLGFWGLGVYGFESLGFRGLVLGSKVTKKKEKKEEKKTKTKKRKRRRKKKKKNKQQFNVNFGRGGSEHFLGGRRGGSNRMVDCIKGYCSACVSSCT